MTGSGFEELSRAHERTKAELARATRELRELIGIGIRLAAERDSDALLDLILTTARQITWADAGSLYLVDVDGTGTRCLRFQLVQSDSLAVPLKEHAIPIDDQSAPGYAALSGEVINLPDATAPPAGSPFTIDRAFDRQTGYRTKSILVVPMRTPKGEVLGVLQLINRRPDRARRFSSLDDIAREAIPFSARSQDLAIALAAQGAVALENSRLYAELRAALATVEESQQRIIRTERLRALGEMAGGVAHDFNNVLAVVVGRAQLLQRQVESPRSAPTARDHRAGRPGRRPDRPPHPGVRADAPDAALAARGLDRGGPRGRGSDPAALERPGAGARRDLRDAARPRPRFPP